MTVIFFKLSVFVIFLCLALSGFSSRGHSKMIKPKIKTLIIVKNENYILIKSKLGLSWIIDEHQQNNPKSKKCNDLIMVYSFRTNDVFELKL